MTKDDVLGVIIKHFKTTVEGAERVQVDPAMSMKDLGASSLDMVEIVALSMRELKVKVPRSQMAKLTNVGGLADLLYQAKQEAVASA